ncbi:Maf family protein [Pontiella sulfatireligans]|uniref:dTTP/UTP pyrophosphatase n=1 Tax=Pontiella sulfatireligans TaxID=2750658 RepID=A0A6C2UP13_9BACT|nr:Maf family protein [Pontiella sulfatireligans]VGO22005.1 Maf-like protein YhdE [Pontiella sulfatireligans]
MQNNAPFGTLVLASASPRRREMLASLGLSFDVIVPEIDETPRPGEAPRAFVERMAKEKAETVQDERIVIAADTVVVLQNRILGKPADEAHASEMLSTLSGASHEVITGTCIRQGGRFEVFSVSTEVVFRELEKAEIEAYIATGCPMDKAGAYAIQGGAAHMVRSINGSYTNVVGLPLCELYEMLISF